MNRNTCFLSLPNLATGVALFVLGVLGFIASPSARAAAVAPTFSVTVQTNAIFADGSTNSDGGVGGSVKPVLTSGISNRTYTLTAKAAAGWDFSGWSGDVSTNHAALKILVRSNITVVATFTERAFNPVKGTYYGLFNPSSPSDPVTTANSGAITMSVTDLGAVSGKLTGVTESFVTNITRHLGVTNVVVKTNFVITTLSFSGKATNEDTGELTISIPIPRPKKSPLQLTGQFVGDLAQFFGSVIRGDGGTNDVSAYLAQNFPAPCPFAGIYTSTLTTGNSDDPTTNPPGFGAFTVKVGTNGSVLFAGTLPDKTPISQGSFIGGVSFFDAPSGYWSCYVPLGGGVGMIHGLIVYGQEAETNSFDGDPVYWIRPGKTGPITRLAAELSGLEYFPPKRGTNAVLWTNGIAMFTDGNINASGVAETDSAFHFLANNKATFLDGNSNKVSLTITPATGLASGSFLNPTTHKATPFKGVVLQTPTNGVSAFGGYLAGWFLGTNEFGSVYILENTP